MNRLAKLKTWYLLHKWLSIVIGLLIVMWLISGIVITSPDLIGYTWPTSHDRADPPNFRNVTISPASAIAQLAKTLGQMPAVDAIELRPIRDRLVYRIVVDEHLYLLDAITGKNFTLTEELARQIAYDAIGSDTPLLNISTLQQHDWVYLYGRVPAYRFAFEDARRTYVYVAVESGEVYMDDQITRVIMRLEALHTFHIGDAFLPNREQMVTILLWLASLFTVLVAATGYLLALPRRWQLWRP